MTCAAATGVTVNGTALAACSALLNGTFAMMGKLCKEEPDPIIFNSMLCLGIFLSSMMTIPFFPLVHQEEEASAAFPLGWTWPGALAGTFLVFATLFSFIAIPRAGLAVAAATWSCCAILVSFLWGAVGPEGVAQAMASPGLSAAALFLLVLGALVLNACGAIAQKLRSGPVAATASHGGLREDMDAEMLQKDALKGGAYDKSEDGCASDGSTAALSGGGGGEAEAGAEGGAGGAAVGTQLLGVLSALCVGLFGGSVLVPAAYVEPELRGLPLLPSFGAACAAVGTLVGAGYWAARRGELGSIGHELRREVVVNGIAAGFLWNGSNVCQIVAMNYLCMPYGVSYPILQCGLLVAGVWGIYLFKEVQHSDAITIFWLGACVLMAGVVLLGLYGPGTA